MFSPSHNIPKSRSTALATAFGALFKICIKAQHHIIARLIWTCAERKKEWTIYMFIRQNGERYVAPRGPAFRWWTAEFSRSTNVDDEINHCTRQVARNSHLDFFIFFRSYCDHRTAMWAGHYKIGRTINPQSLRSSFFNINMCCCRCFIAKVFFHFLIPTKIPLCKRLRC